LALCEHTGLSGHLTDIRVDVRSAGLLTYWLLNNRLELMERVGRDTGWNDGWPTACRGAERV
jgi:hypothetical protein